MELQQKLKKYFEITSEGLKKAKIKSNLNAQDKKSAECLIDLAQRYFDDAKHFEKEGSIVNAFAAVCYSHAFLDAGAISGYLDVDDDRLFMVDKK